MAPHGYTLTLSPLFLTIAAVGYIDAISFIQAANAQLPDQEKCAADAKQTFQQVESEYAAESKRLEIEVTSGTYASHYNAKIKQCLLSINRSTSLAQETSITSYLLDTNQRLYAFYFETDGKMLTCTLTPTVKETTFCKTHQEFDAFVAKYMEE